VDCRLRVSLKLYAAFFSCGRWAPAIPTWVTTQSHHLLSMFVDFGLSATNTQSHDLLFMFVDFGLSVPTSGIPRLLTTPGLNLDTTMPHKLRPQGFRMGSTPGKYNVRLRLHQEARPKCKVPCIQNVCTYIARVVHSRQNLAMYTVTYERS